VTGRASAIFRIPSGATVAAARRMLAEAFRAARLDAPALDARLIVGHALDLDHTALIGAAERALSEDEAADVTDFAMRRLAREPVARIIGCKEFWGLPIRLGPATLVPRPQTETVVEAALAAVDATGGRARTLRVADLGTGSGALLLALLSEMPHAVGVGTDVEPCALAVARDNAARLGLADRTHFVTCSFGAPLAGGFDLVVSNPPYVAAGDIAGLAPEVRAYDPRIALDGGPDGLAAYRAIAADGRRLIASRGRLVVELGAGALADVVAIFSAAGFVAAPARADLAGVARALPLHPVE